MPYLEPELLQVAIDGSPGDLYDPPVVPQLSCGSLRQHDAHQWTGQTSGKKFTCPGWTPLDPERQREAERRLVEENAGLTDDWREDA